MTTLNMTKVVRKMRTAEYIGPSTGSSRATWLELA